MARPVKAAVTRAKRELHDRQLDIQRRTTAQLVWQLREMTSERDRCKRRIDLLEEQRDTLLRALRDAQPQEHRIHDGVSPAID